MMTERNTHSPRHSLSQINAFFLQGEVIAHEKPAASVPNNCSRHSDSGSSSHGNVMRSGAPARMTFQKCARSTFHPIYHLSLKACGCSCRMFYGINGLPLETRKPA